MGKFTKKTATSSKVSEKTAAPAEQQEKTIDPEIAALAGHTCTVMKGRKFKIGSTLDIVEIKLNKYGKPYGVTFIKGEKVFVDPTNVEPTKPIPATKLALIQSELETSSNERFLIPASVRNESDKALCLQYYGDGDDIEGWHRPIWFPKSMVERLCDLDDGDAIYSVPGWKIRSPKDGRPSSVEGIMQLQEALEELVEASKKPKQVLIKKSAVKK